MKICGKCRVEKPTEQFAKNKRKKDGLQNSCRLCVKEINAEYYKRTPEKNPARRAANVANILKNKQYVLSILKKSSCVDCGQDDWRVLEFDHVRGVKSANVSNLIRCAYGIETIQSEINKCEIRCANCHRIKTGIDFGWYKTLSWEGDDLMSEETRIIPSTGSEDRNHKPGQGGVGPKQDVQKTKTTHDANQGKTGK